MSENKSLSVVVPIYNRREDLIRALDSLVQQTDKDFEVIVCDDGSTEDISGVVYGYNGYLRLRFLRIDNSGGPARPRNTGTRAATTEWISFLDSDDWWYPNRVKRVKEALSKEWDIVYHSLEVTRADGDWKATPSHGTVIGSRMCCDNVLMHMLRFGNPFPTSATTVRRDAMEAIGGFNEERKLASAEDYDAWLQLATGGVRAYFLNETLGAYWVSNDNISKPSEKHAQALLAVYRRMESYAPSAMVKKAAAHFYYAIGLCYMHAKNFTESAKFFLKVLSQPSCRYKGKSIFRLSQILFQCVKS